MNKVAPSWFDNMFQPIVEKLLNIHKYFFQNSFKSNLKTIVEFSHNWGLSSSHNWASHRNHTI